MIPSSTPSILGARLQLFKDRWKHTFGESWVTQLITNGYSPEWHTIPPLRLIPLSSKGYSTSDSLTFKKEIDNLLNIGAIEEMDASVPCFTSSLFMVPKKTGDLRPVIDLRSLNRYVTYQHFKMENLDLVKSLIRRNDYMVSIDLNHAFYHVPLAPSQKQFFAFDFLGKRYCFKCLPFGLTSSPRIFTKVLRPLIKLIRSKGIRVVAYLDDLLLMARTKEELLLHTASLRKCLQDHGFTINENKSCLTPSHVIDYLGFQINSRLMVMKLPRKKLQSLIRECRKAKQLIHLPVRKLASLIGKIISTMNAILPARLYSRALLRDKNLALKMHGWNGSVTLSNASLTQLNWWIIKLPECNGKSLISETQQISCTQTHPTRVGEQVWKEE